MTDNKTHFDDAAAYDRFMGRWTRGVGSAFLDWLAPPAGVRWRLDGERLITRLALDPRSEARLRLDVVPFSAD